MNWSVVQRNMIANFASKGFVAIAGLLFIPLYIRFLGIEAYAIAALLPVISALSTILDFGLTPAINRELARLSVEPNSCQAMRDFARTCEIVVWILAVAVGIGTAAVAPLLFGDAGRTQTLSDESLQRAALLMGLVVGLHWPASYYSGAIMGLQKQVLLAVANCMAAGIRGLGAVIILWLVSPTIEAFLLWQAAVSIALTLAVGALLSHYMPAGHRRPMISFKPIKRTWRLAAGMSGTGIVIVVATQMDKVVLSQILPLQTFGYYMLASAVASKLSMIVEPIINSLFPRMTQLAAISDFEALRETYRRGVQLIAVATLPAAVIFVLFGAEILGLWTLNDAYGAASGPLAGALVVGFALFELLEMTMFLDWALGKTRQVFWARLVGTVMLLPALILLAHYFGALGGALAWPLVNGIVVLIAVPVVHATWKESGAWLGWYAPAVAYPLLASLFVAGCWSLATVPTEIVPRGAFLGAVLGTTYLAAALTNAPLRAFATRTLSLLQVRSAALLGRGG